MTTPEAPSEEAAGIPRKGLSLSDPALQLSFDGSVAAADQTAPVIQQGVEFDPAGGAALFPPTAVLAYPDSGGIDPEEGTIALWVRRETDAEDGKGRGIVELLTGTWENRIEMGMGPTYLRFMLTTSDGIENGVGAGIHWGQREWHHVAVTWGEALVTLYIDGAAMDTRTFAGGAVIPPATPLYIASSRRGADSSAAPISLRALTVFQRSLLPEEVAQVLSETAPRS